MNTILRILKILLAIGFLSSGIMKSTQSEQWLITHGQTGVKGLPAAVITFIGICEILGVFGLILPWWFNIAPVLTPTAAICFCIVMLLAAPRHYKLKEPKNVAINIIIFFVCAFVTYERLTSLAK